MRANLDGRGFASRGVHARIAIVLPVSDRTTDIRLAFVTQPSLDGVFVDLVYLGRLASRWIRVLE